MKKHIKSEEAPAYAAQAACPEKMSDDDIVRRALEIVAARMARGQMISSPADTKNFLRLNLADRERESFCVLFLDTRHRVISFEELFHGTIDGASVFPRVVVQRALCHNAADVILAHNHPSGVPEPSAADIAITARLREALALIDVRVLDHIVVGAEGAVSLAERGAI